MKFVFKTRMLLAAALLLVHVTASAHTHLEKSVPADDATVKVAPAYIDLTFNGPVRLVKFQVMGVGHEMPTKFEASTETAAEFHIETPGMHPGQFTVNWAVIGEDGHTVTDSFGFVVDPAAAETASN